jgi:hypothetical protein
MGEHEKNKFMTMKTFFFKRVKTILIVLLFYHSLSWFPVGPPKNVYTLLGYQNVKDEIAKSHHGDKFPNT